MFSVSLLVCLFVCSRICSTRIAVITPHIYKHKLRCFAPTFVRQRVFILLRHPKHVRRAQPERIRVDAQPNFAGFAPQHHHDQAVLPAVLAVLSTLRRDHELPCNEKILRFERGAACDGRSVGVERNEGQIGVVADELDLAFVGRNEARIGERRFGYDFVVEKDLAILGNNVLRVRENGGEAHLRGGERRRGVIDGEGNLGLGGIGWMWG